MAPSGTNFSMSDVYRKLCTCLTLHLFHTTDNGQRKFFHSKVPIRDVILLYGSLHKADTTTEKKAHLGIKRTKNFRAQNETHIQWEPIISGTFVLIEFRKLMIRNIHRIDSNQPLHHFVTHEDLIL